MTVEEALALPLEADLSRADAALLARLCAGRRVVEFGSGGSTLLLARVAAYVASYDTDATWTELTRARLAEEPAGSVCAVDLWTYGGVPDQLPAADVALVDGAPGLRPAWTRALVERGVPLVLVHDSRGDQVGPALAALGWPASLRVRSVELHAEGSHTTVVRCGEPVAYEDWNQTEPEGRAPHLHRRGRSET